MAYQSDYDGQQYEDERDDPNSPNYDPNWRTSGGDVAPTGAPFVQPSRDPGQSAYQGIDYWQGQGKSPFDASGNLAPGFSRTNNGYAYQAGAGEEGGVPTGDPAPTPGLGPFTGTFTPPQGRELPGIPTYTPPPAFAAPSVSDALNDPGYQFRTQQGQGALERWSAARGTLNDSGTAKALIDYGQNAATQEYQNVWNRRKGEYDTNAMTQFEDPYRFAYAGAVDNRDRVQHQNDQDYQSAWQKYLSDIGLWEFNTNTAVNLAGA